MSAFEPAERSAVNLESRTKPKRMVRDAVRVKHRQSIPWKASFQCPNYAVPIHF